MQKPTTNTPLLTSKIFLVGFMGVGKTTAGKKFSNYLNYAFIDTDLYIEQKEGISIKEIFESKGEAYFRKREKEALLTLIKDNRPLVISTGGGMGANEELMRLMNQNGKVIYIHLPFHAILKRLKDKHDRPLAQNLSDEKNKEKLAYLFKERLPIYLKAAICIDGHYLKKMGKEEINQLLNK